ncbi:hypothetical protein MVEG_08134 [Podila verticillata NRRL 6337]|nr:hypothetical protein MVEG_08134 [Podila verticillata NRRL 6337]
MSSPEIEIKNATEFSLPPPTKAEVYSSTAKARAALTEDDWANMKKPKVLIVGAGIGGLMLGALLKKGNTPFEIWERAKEVKPLGSAMVVGANIQAVFQQLGIYEELVAIGKPVTHVKTFQEDLSLFMDNDYSERRTMGGTIEFVVARPDLYNILLRQVPKENIHMGKKVLWLLQNDEGVMIKCADNQTHHGDILVGADGAYSAVRQQLFKTLKDKDLLPESDDVALPFSSVCLVGQTEVLDSEEFPDLKLEQSQFLSVMGEGRFNWATFTTKQNTVCYMVLQYLNKETAKSNDSFRNSEWGPEAAETMCKDVRHFKIPGGKDGKILTIGDLIDRTPKSMISKVMLEEKVFDTWYGGRTVLLGDACHKMNPAGGAGAISAIHDAVTLANWICALQPKKASDISMIFKEYYDERYPIVKEANEQSQMLSKVNGKGLVPVVLRALLKRIPYWLWRKMLVKMSLSRPQVSFLPLAEDKGTLTPKYQPSLQKTLEILKRRATEQTQSDQTNVTATV